MTSTDNIPDALLALMKGMGLTAEEMSRFSLAEFFASTETERDDGTDGD